MSARRAALAASALALLMPAGLLMSSETGSASDSAAAPPATTSVVTAAGQRVRLQALPPIVQPGGRVASPDAARAAITATIKPVLAGRKFRLQVQSGDSWKKVATLRQGRQGRVQFPAPSTEAGQPLSYRVRALAHGGLPAITSGTVSTARWRAPTWTDEFSGSSLSSGWSHRGEGYSLDSMRRCSRADPKAVRVADGSLRLSVFKDRTKLTKCKALVRGKVAGRYAYRLNGHVGTERGFSFRYGFAAARMKFHQLRGQHSAFWMQPVGGMYPGGAGHEIDIIEYFGDDHPRGGLTTFIHRYVGSEVVRTGARVSDDRSFLRNRWDGWSKNYHVFSVEWTPRTLVFRIDGKETNRINGGISSVRQYPILSLLSSDYELPEMRDRQLPQHTYVDWIRVWETGD